MKSALPVLSSALLFISVIFTQSCQHASSQPGGDPANYQQQVMSVEEIEKSDPSRFLDASGTYNPNFWGDQMKIHGTVENKATVANYKDVVVEITFYSQTETVLDTKQYTLYDYFPAHQTKAFELKVPIPQGCKKLGWDAINATPY